jgi:hypothetical protein
MEYRGSEGQVTMALINSQTAASAQYSAQGRFEKGAARLRLGLIKQGDTWMVEGFHIEPSDFMKRLVGVRS